MTPGRKYVLDTQLYIRAFRETEANEALQDFHRRYAPFEYLSAIVAQELRAGVRDPGQGRQLEKNVLSIYARVGRLLAPSMGAWQRSGDVLARMRAVEGLEIARVTKSFANHLLLALSCEESGCVLVTENAKDFLRIQSYVSFEFVPPWP